jgi:hypothetical protein
MHQNIIAAHEYSNAVGERFLRVYLRLSKLKTGSCSFGGNKNGQKSLEFILDKNSHVTIVEIAFPRSVYLFHCSTPNNAGGDETTFAFAVTHHQNSSQG